MNKTIKLNKHIKAFLVTKFFAYSQQAFFGIFINIYLWRLTNDISILVFYNIIFTLFHGLAILPAGKIAKEYNRFLPLRLGLIIQIFFLSLILYLKEDIISNLILVGILGGIGHGLYWASDDILKFDLTNPSNRLSFTSTFHILKNFAKGLIPLFASYLIVKNGELISSYHTIFLCAFIITLLSLISSFFISNVKQFKTQDYNFFNTSLNLLKNKKIRIILYSTILSKFSETLPILLGLLLFFATGSELSIGSYQFITLFLAIISNYLLMKLFNSSHYKKLLIYGGIINFSLIFILFVNQSFSGLLLYGILTSIFAVTNNPRHPVRLDTINGYAKNKEELLNIRIEYINLMELFDIFGKLLSFIFLGLLALSMNFYLIAIIASILALGKLFANFLIAKIENKDFINIDTMN